MERELSIFIGLEAQNNAQNCQKRSFREFIDEKSKFFSKKTIFQTGSKPEVTHVTHKNEAE